MTPKYMTIGRACKTLGVEPYTLRFWQANGVISSTRSGSNQRRFRSADVHRLAEIMPWRDLLTVPGLAAAMKGEIKRVTS